MPVTVAQLRAACKAAMAAHRRLNFKVDPHVEDAFTMSLALSAAVKKLFFEKSGTKFSDEPTIEKRRVTHFGRHMRVDAMEKFDVTSMLSAVHFYTDPKSMEAAKPAGLVIVYVRREGLPELLRLLKYPYIDHEEDEEVYDGIGAMVNLAGGYFKKELGRLGYADLEMSHFKSYQNTIVDGIEYPLGQAEKYEISFQIEGEKQLVVETVMGPLPKQTQRK